mmetsp:Transcript_9294/g.11363  ORF Transcript_9294/g.11363 Transcript_9294/m.11363 type:complete len:254 (-) Transcript_9294:658-1419(-)
MLFRSLALLLMLSRAEALHVSRSGPILASATTSSGWAINDLTPDGRLMQRVEGQTRKTWTFKDYSRDRVQVAVAGTSEARPIHSEIQLWIGPDWTPFTLKAYSEDGKKRPIQTLIGTRNKAAMIEVRNTGEYEFPFNAASNYPKGAMATLAEDLPATTQGELIQGNALRSFNLKSGTTQLELILKTDGKQLNARIEMLDGPNNPKQCYEVFTNNGELNSLVVCFDVEQYAGNTLRIMNLAPVEFPCYCFMKEA